MPLEFDAAEIEAGQEHRFAVDQEMLSSRVEQAILRHGLDLEAIASSAKTAVVGPEIRRIDYLLIGLAVVLFCAIAISAIRSRMAEV